MTELDSRDLLSYLAIDVSRCLHLCKYTVFGKKTDPLDLVQ